MIKTLALVLVIFNPADDSEHEVVYGTYTHAECLINESYINLKDSSMNIELKRNKLELVETYCE